MSPRPPCPPKHQKNDEIPCPRVHGFVHGFVHVFVEPLASAILQLRVPFFVTDTHPGRPRDPICHAICHPICSFLGAFWTYFRVPLAIKGESPAYEETPLFTYRNSCLQGRRAPQNIKKHQNSSPQGARVRAQVRARVRRASRKRNFATSAPLFPRPGSARGAPGTLYVTLYVTIYALFGSFLEICSRPFGNQRRKPRL